MVRDLLNDTYSVEYGCGVESKRNKTDMGRASLVAVLLHPFKLLRSRSVGVETKADTVDIENMIPSTYRTIT